MSALGGIYNLDDEPVNEKCLAEMGRRLALRGPDGGSELKARSVGMVYRAFHTTRESRLETQPLRSGSGHILCWDGRLDNREELISILRQNILGEHTDVAIVLASYLKWGTAFPSRIIGDFALSLWDANSRTLLLARDPVGVRQLYYLSNEQRIVWSTDLGLLVDLAGGELRINEEYIADFLTRRPEPGQTPYHYIYAVPPAHVVIARRGQIRISRFWGLDPTREIRYKTDAEYEEHFRHLFRDAVRCRLRADGPVWAELSGGFDSSSIVCMADAICKSGEAEASSIETVSRVFDEACGSDERKYIHPVEAKIGRKGLHLREDDHRMLTPLGEKYSILFPNPIADVAEYYHALGDAMQKRGARVLLMGQGGDEILTSSPDCAPELAELLLRCRLLELHRRLGVWSKAQKQPYVRVLWRKAVVPALPDKLLAFRKTSSAAKISTLYSPEFVNRMKLRERLLGPPNEFGFRYPIGQMRSRHFAALVRSVSSGNYQALLDVVITFPYTHRPLIEFMQAVPFDQSVRPGETRSIAHRALRNLLPAEVANRKDKGLNIHAYLSALARESGRLDRLFIDARVCAWGYVNPKALEDLLNLAKNGNNQRSSMLMFLICLEYWLRAVERRQSAARSGTSIRPCVTPIGSPDGAQAHKENLIRETSARDSRSMYEHTWRYSQF